MERQLDKEFIDSLERIGSKSTRLVESVVEKSTPNFMNLLGAIETWLDNKLQPSDRSVNDTDSFK